MVCARHRVRNGRRLTGSSGLSGGMANGQQVLFQAGIHVSLSDDSDDDRGAAKVTKDMLSAKEEPSGSSLDHG